MAGSWASAALEGFDGSIDYSLSVLRNVTPLHTDGKDNIAKIVSSLQAHNIDDSSRGVLLVQDDYPVFEPGFCQYPALEYFREVGKSASVKT